MSRRASTKYPIGDQLVASSLYWVYAWDENETKYNFDAYRAIRDARKAMKEFMDGTFDGHAWHHAYIWPGDENGAWTQFDPVETKGRR